MERATRRILAVCVAEGKRHDFTLLKDSKLRLKQETAGVYDAGYQGAQHHHANTRIPFKKPRGGTLTKEQKRFNRALARERVVNEHVIGSLKRFRILAERYRNRRKRYGLRLNLLAAIHNMELEGGISAC